MKLIPNEILLEKLLWRYATKRFDRERTIPEEDVSTLKEALRLAPSSFGLQPWKFIFITDQDIRAKLLPVSWGQPQVIEASHLVVLCSQLNVNNSHAEALIDSICKTRNIEKTAIEEYKRMMIGFLENPLKGFTMSEWATKQVYLALGLLLTTAAVLGIDACPMEGFEHEKYDEILGLTIKGYTASVVCALGYRSSEDKYANAIKVRYDIENIVEEI
jgi:nitroreductase